MINKLIPENFYIGKRSYSRYKYRFTSYNNDHGNSQYEALSISYHTHSIDIFSEYGYSIEYSRYREIKK